VTGADIGIPKRQQTEYFFQICGKTLARLAYSTHAAVPQAAYCRDWEKDADFLPNLDTAAIDEPLRAGAKDLRAG
jgi:hypothetical protein